MYAEGGTRLYKQLGLELGLTLSTKGIVPHSDQIPDYHSPSQYQAMLMHVPLLARTRLPTFYLYRCTIFLSRNISCKVLDFASSIIVLNKVLQSFVKTLTCLFQPTSKLSEYPGNPPASRLLATWATISACIFDSGLKSKLFLSLLKLRFYVSMRYEQDCQSN